MSQHFKDNTRHLRKDRWGQIVLPSRAYGAYKQMRADGMFHPLQTWQIVCCNYRKKISKMKIAKASRRRNRG